MNLNQVTLPTLDLEKSISFYQTLGLQLIVHSSPHYARFECPDGEATMSLHLVDKIGDLFGTSIYFECQDVDTTVAALNEKGLKFDLLPTDQRWLWREARLKDPFGNQIILFHAGENRKNPPWRIN